MDTRTFLTTEELAVRLRYDARYVREYLKDSVLIEGIHYIRPFGRRKILFIWEAVELDMMKNSQAMIPMTKRRVCNG